MDKDDDTLTEGERNAADAIVMLRRVAERLPPEELPRFAAQLNHFCEQQGIGIQVGFGNLDEDSEPPVQ